VPPDLELVEKTNRGSGCYLRFSDHDEEEALAGDYARQRAANEHDLLIRENRLTPVNF